MKHVNETLGKSITWFTIKEEKTFKIDLKDFYEKGNKQMKG